MRVLASSLLVLPSQVRRESHRVSSRSAVFPTPVSPEAGRQRRLAG